MSDKFKAKKDSQRAVQGQSLKSSHRKLSRGPAYNAQYPSQYGFEVRESTATQQLNTTSSAGEFTYINN